MVASLTSWMPSKLVECLRTWRSSRKLTLFIVVVALFLDSMLLTTIVPIIPNFLFELEHPDMDALPVNYTDDLPASTTTRSTVSPNAVAMTTRCRCDDVTRPPHRRVDRDPGDGGLYPYAYALAESYAAGSRKTGYASRDLYRSSDGADEDETGSGNGQPMNRTITRESRHRDILVGLLFASKAILQLIASPFVGPITNRIGYSIPMFIGLVIMFVSTIIFTLGESFTVLFIARAVQGIGSACSSVSGMGMLADRYPDDRERGSAMSIVLGGMALGMLVGPPFGGVMYEFVSKEAPFLVLAGLVLFDGLLQLTVLQLEVHPEDQKGTPLKVLLRDPYILIAAGSITFANMGLAMLEPSLPLWMLDTMSAPKWQQGVVFVPASIAYLIGASLFGPLAHKIGRWLCAMLGMAVVGICLVAIPFSKSFYDLLALNSGWGVATGTLESAMMPLMGYLVDLRHVPVYGNVYAIADVAFYVGFAVGPALSGWIIKGVGFKWMMWIMAIATFLYAPLLIFLRNPPGKEEKQALMMDEKSMPVQRITYNSHKYERFENSDDEEDARMTDSRVAGARNSVTATSRQSE